VLAELRGQVFPLCDLSRASEASPTANIALGRRRLIPHCSSRRSTFSTGYASTPYPDGREEFRELVRRRAGSTPGLPSTSSKICSGFEPRVPSPNSLAFPTNDEMPASTNALTMGVRNSRKRPQRNRLCAEARIGWVKGIRTNVPRAGLRQSWNGPQSITIGPVWLRSVEEFDLAAASSTLRRYSLPTKRVSPRYSMLARGAGRGRRRRSDLPGVIAPPA
jgi:hypothetical protein